MENSRRSLAPGPLYGFLSGDHDRLDALLRRTTAQPDAIDHTAYARFREGLLRHIAMEEKVLFPFARDRSGSESLPVIERMHLDHGALAALLVPTPTLRILAAIRTILEAHNPIEEGAGGFYETCEVLAGSEVDLLLDRVQSVREVRVAPHADNERAMESTRQAVRRAGYRLEF